MFQWLMWYFVLFALLPQPSVAYDNDDFEIFDLVEEINKNFYEVIGVAQSASSSEVRRAYRKLSVQMHPDKGGDENTFRQLNAIYEVLKDAEKRKKYDLVLEHGLPDWRQPVFYYRRVRKMGLLELSGLLMLILTIGHFLVSWAAYLEKKFTLEEFFRSAKRRQEKKSRKKKGNIDDDEFEEQLQENLKVIPRPQLKDLLPFKLVGLVYSLVMNLPQIVADVKEKMKKKEEVLENDEEDSEVTKKRRQRIVTPDADFKPQMAEYTAPVVTYDTSICDGNLTSESSSKSQKEGEWTEEELAFLAKATVKFPGGTANRWEKIAAMVGRTVEEVIARAKEIKSQYAKQVDPAAQGTVGAGEPVKMKKGHAPSDAIISTRDPSEYMDSNVPETAKKRTRHTKVAKTKERTLLISQQPAAAKSISDTSLPVEKSNVDNVQGANNTGVEDSQLWTQNQQKVLEWALVQYPKGTEERWEKIAEHISGKTKEECMLRFKYLADLVKKRKESQKSS